MMSSVPDMMAAQSLVGPYTLNPTQNPIPSALLTAWGGGGGG